MALERVTPRHAVAARVGWHAVDRDSMGGRSTECEFGVRVGQRGRDKRCAEAGVESHFQVAALVEQHDIDAVVQQLSRRSDDQERLLRLDAGVYDLVYCVDFGKAVP